MEDYDHKEPGEVFSRVVKAGKRTYFFDVKKTRTDDLFVCITESKKRFDETGYFYEKHKVFLYKDDFEKFIASLTTVIDYIKTSRPEPTYLQQLRMDPNHPANFNHQQNHQDHQQNHTPDPPHPEQKKDFDFEDLNF